MGDVLEVVGCPCSVGQGIGRKGKHEHGRKYTPGRPASSYPGAAREAAPEPDGADTRSGRERPRVEAAPPRGSGTSYAGSQLPGGSAAWATRSADAPPGEGSRGTRWWTWIWWCAAGFLLYPPRPRQFRIRKMDLLLSLRATNPIPCLISRI